MNRVRPRIWHKCRGSSRLYSVQGGSPGRLTLFKTSRGNVMKNLTERQKKILRIILRDVKKQGFPPTMQELADELGIRSKNAIYKQLAALESKGFIRKHGGGSARSITILKTLGELFEPPSATVPVLGGIQAGMPMLAEENIERYVPVPDYLTKDDSQYFALRVQGDSMIDAGIHEGDLVIVRSTREARHGDIVVAITGEEATVKRFVETGHVKYLKPENSAYADIPLSEAWSIQGTVVSLIREKVN